MTGGVRGPSTVGRFLISLAISTPTRGMAQVQFWVAWPIFTEASCFWTLAQSRQVRLLSRELQGGSTIGLAELVWELVQRSQGQRRGWDRCRAERVKVRTARLGVGSNRQQGGTWGC